MSNLDLYLKAGLAVSAQADPGVKFAAVVDAVSPTEVTVRVLPHEQSAEFRVGGVAQIKYWDRGSAVYGWMGEVKVYDPESRELVVEVLGRQFTIQRRKSYRIPVAVPFSFTVISALKSTLVGGGMVQAHTDNLSTGGLAFASRIPLELGDKLDLDLYLGEHGEANAVGWVVRSIPIENDPAESHFVALQFLQLTAEDQCRLHQFLQSKIGEPALAGK